MAFDKLNNFRRVFLLAGFLLLFAIIWVFGFLSFVSQIPIHVADNTSKTNAIVILTGGSERLSSGIDLLSQGKADKMFISGAGQGVDLQTMLILSGPLPDNIGELLSDIHVGYDAADTEGNARETSKWMNENRFSSLRLVTANYHTPRSILEFTKAMPDIKVVPHPVFPDRVIIDQWWKSDGSKHLLVSEYNKYIISKLFRFIGS